MHPRLLALRTLWQRSLWPRTLTRERASWLPLLRMALVLTVAIALGWVYTLHLVEENRARVLDSAASGLGNLGRAGQEQAERSIRSVDQLLMVVRGQYLEHGGRIDLQALTRQGQRDAAFIRDVSMADARGILVLGSLPLRWRVDVSEQAYFLAQKANRGDTLYIAEPRPDGRIDDGNILSLIHI